MLGDSVHTLPVGGGNERFYCLPSALKLRRSRRKIFSRKTRSKMNNLDGLNTFLRERLMTVAGEIFQVFKDAFSEYQSEIERIKQENRYLREALAEIYNSVQERAGNHLLPH